MKPIEFPGSNVLLGANQSEYQPLPALAVGDPQGTVISCWELTDEDLAALTATRKLWFSQLTFGQALQPQLPAVECPAVTDAPPTQQTVDNAAPATDDEITDLYRADCLVSRRYSSPMDMIADIGAQAMRALIVAAGGVPPVGSVISLMMSVDRSQAVEDGLIVLPGARA